MAIVLGEIASAQVRYGRGQNVAPVFEGWERNPDGSFNMVFGYMNRNYEEQPHVPIGPNNFVEPGPQDQGQPTHFYPRRQQFVFRVRVPADWGEKDLVWTLTHNGRTDKAYGSLWPVWEIDSGVLKANRGQGLTGATYDNQRPFIQVVGDATTTVTLPDTLTLTVQVSDDGVPGPRPPRRQTPQQQQQQERRLIAPQRPGPTSQAVVDARVAAKTGLAVTWTHYRGPGKVTFDPQVPPITEGKAVTTVSFSDPGTHVLRAYADDSIFTTPVDVTVTVRGAASQVQR